MSRTVPPTLSLALHHLRVQKAWTQAELARAARIRRQNVCDFETGIRRRLDQPTLMRLAATMGYSPGEVDLALAFVAAFKAPAAFEALTPIDPSPAEVRRARRLASQVGLAEASRMFADLLDVGRIRRMERARSAADRLWEQLVKEVPARLGALAEQVPKVCLWAVVERLCAESARAAADDAARALHLANLARRLAGQAPGASSWRSLLEGYACAFIANAQRVGSDLPAAEATFATAWRLWRAAGPHGGGRPLGEWRLHDLEASLRRDLRQFDAALRCLDHALGAVPSAMHGRILLNKVATLEQAGDFAGGLLACEEAALLLDAQGEPRDRWGVRFNAVVLLCHLGRFAAAAEHLPELRRLAEERHDRLDLTRTRWLSGRVAAGLGDYAEAYASFEEVRRDFTKRKLAYDVALVSLELSVLLLELGQSADVTAMARDMVWIFRSQKVHREGLAALRLFCTAARAGSATADLAQRVSSFLERARYDHRLRFAGPPA